MRQLRGGMGDMIVKIVPKRDRTEKQLRKDENLRRDRDEVMFDLQAVAEAGAIRQHRELVPARQHIES